MEEIKLPQTFDNRSELLIIKWHNPNYTSIPLFSVARYYSDSKCWLTEESMMTINREHVIDWKEFDIF